MSPAVPSETWWNPLRALAACTVACLLVLSAPVCTHLLRSRQPPAPLSAQAAAAALRQIDAEILKADSLAAQAGRAPGASALRRRLAREAIDHLDTATGRLIDVDDRSSLLPGMDPAIESRMNAIVDSRREARRVLAE